MAFVGRISVFAAFIAVVLLFPVAVLAHPYERARTADVSIAWEVASINATSKWIRVTNTDSKAHVRLLGIHPLNFDITAITAVRASGAQLPGCTLSTAPTTYHYVFCTGDLPPDSTLLLHVTTSGTGGDYEIAASDAFDPSTLAYAPDTEIGTLLPATAKFESRGTTNRATVTFNTGANAFDEIEILPYQTAITKVISATNGIACDMVGNGLDCTAALAAGTTASITFDTAQTSGTPSADVVLSGADGVADVFVQRTVGAAPKYDLAVTGPASAKYKRGLKLKFTVSNGGEAASSATSVSAKAKGLGTVSCAPKTVGALEPGKSASCTVTLKPAKAPKPGKIALVVSVRCSGAETSCRNNSTRVTLSVR